MPRTKTTIYLESELLPATKAVAASSGRRKYEIVERHPDDEYLIAHAAGAGG